MLPVTTKGCRSPYASTPRQVSPHRPWRSHIIWRRDQTCHWGSQEQSRQVSSWLLFFLAKGWGSATGRKFRPVQDDETFHLQSCLHRARALHACVAWWAPLIINKVRIISNQSSVISPSRSLMKVAVHRHCLGWRPIPWVTADVVLGTVIVA